MDAKERHEALTEEHEVESAVLLRPDAPNEAVYVSVVKEGRSNVRLCVHSSNQSNAVQLIIGRERLLERVRDPQDGS